MNKLIITFFLFASIVFSQDYEDVVYLKDGSIIHGLIIEHKPGEYYKIKSGKNLFVFTIDEIDIIKKEEKEDSQLIEVKKTKAYYRVVEYPDISDKTWSFGFGLFSNNGPTFLRISKDFKLNDNAAFHLYFGNPDHLSYGAGFSFQPHYNYNGWKVAFSIGKMYDDFEYLDNRTLNLTYQIRNRRGENSFWSVGIMYNTHQQREIDWANWDWNQWSYQSECDNDNLNENCNSYIYSWDSFLLPVISWDFRF